MSEAALRAGIFQGVAPDAVAQVVASLAPVSFRRGEVVFAEGDGGDVPYVIATGRVKVGRRTGDGQQSLLAIMGPGDVFDELALFDPGPRTSTVTALTALDALTMDRDALRSWIREHSEIGEQLLRVLARRLRRTNDALAALVFTDVPGRVAKQLLGLAQRWGARDGDGLRIDLELTQTELAQLVGASWETVNKALNDFVHRGWVRLDGKTVYVHDSERLARRAR